MYILERQNVASTLPSTAMSLEIRILGFFVGKNPSGERPTETAFFVRFQSGESLLTWPCDDIDYSSSCYHILLISVECSGMG